MNTNSTQNNDAKRDVNLFVALIPMVVVVGLMFASLLFLHLDMCIPLIVGTVVASLVAVYVLHYKWSEVEEGILKSVTQGLPNVILLGIVGMLIGTWMQGGIVPALIYYSLKLLSPDFFLVTCMIIASIVSVATGSSWSTAGTVGIALVGVGQVMEIPVEMVAGAVISGAYFGDKMSPFSDTTNLAPALAGSTLFDHIKHMVYTTGTSYVLAAIGYIILNRKYTSATLDTSSTEEMMRLLESNFNLSPLLLLPIVFIICMVALKMPTIPGMMMNVLLGIICAALFQGCSIPEMFDAMMNGYVSQTGVALVDDLLTKGGIYSMLPTLVLIICAFIFGGTVTSTGMLQRIAQALLTFAKGTGSLIMVTILTCITVNMAAGEQYLSLIITGSMYKEEYQKRGLAPQNLSRALEDGGTLTSPLVPWCACAVAMSTYLGVATVDYLPYCFLNLINPLVSIIYGFTGFTILKAGEEKVRLRKQK